MANFCIPKHLVLQLKQSALRNEVDIKELYEMSSKDRRAFFTTHTDPELGKLINTEFEKAIVSKQKDAITSWAKSVFDPKSKEAPAFKNVVDKINQLDEMGVLTAESEKAFLEDLVADKLGITVTPEEVKIISDKAEKIDAAQKSLGNDLGNPEKTEENIAFFEAKKDMDDYLQSLTPASNLRVATGTIGRGVMLASIKSPILNIGSNTEIGIMEAISRRLSSMRFKGANSKIALDYVKMVNKIYQKTGYDLSRMTSLSDTGASGRRVLGEDVVHTKGTGPVRATARVVEDIVFKQLMGAPDVAFSSAHFADSVNLNAMTMAKGDRVLATEMMRDAMTLKPQTAEGEVLRNQAIHDAQVATWTNKGWASQLTEGTRKIFNNLAPDARIGDLLFPFVKTPANVISTGVDYAGMGVPKAMIKTYTAFRSGDLGNKQVIQGITRDLVRSGLGITGAVMIAGLLDDDDFVGAYDPARAQIEQLRNSNTNAIRVGNKWISTDWLGPLTVPVTAIMYSRKYGKGGWKEGVFQYGVGVGSAIKNLPVISDIFDYVSGQAYKKNQSLEEMTGEVQNYLTEQIYSRMIPSIISDIAKATDKYDRQTTKGFESVKAKIPGVRQTLPIKKNIFGEDIEGESAITDILVGSRSKTNKETPLVTEIRRVSDAIDKNTNFTNWDKTSSKKIAQFKEKFGEEKFNKAKVEYGQELKKNLEKTISSNKYKKSSDEDKFNMIANTDTEATDSIFKKYRFVYKTPKN